MNYSRLLLAALFSLAISAAQAAWLPLAIPVPIPGATGLTLQNLFAGPTGYSYLNAILSAHNVNFASGVTPANLATDGSMYPETGAANLGGNITLSTTINMGYANAGGNYHVGWPSGTGAVVVPGSVTEVARSSGCTGMSISVGAGVTMSGTPGVGGCDVEYHWTITNNTSPVTITLPSGKPYHNMRGLYLVQDRSGTNTYSNWNLYQSGATKGFDPDYLDFFASWTGSLKSPAHYLNPQVLRFMESASINGSNVFNYDRSPAYGSALVYGSDQGFDYYDPRIWLTYVSGTGTLTSPWTFNYPASGTDPGTWTDGETLQFVLPNALTGQAILSTADNGSGGTTITMASNSCGTGCTFANGDRIYISNVGSGGDATLNSTQLISNVTATTLDVPIPPAQVPTAHTPFIMPVPYIKIGSRAAKMTVLQDSTLPTNSGQFQTGSGATASYISILDQVAFTKRGGGGIQNAGLAFGAPYRVWIDLCNVLHKDCYFSLPAYLTGAAISQLTDDVAQYLDTSLNAYFEYSNEIWNINATAVQTAMIYDMAQAKGYPNTGSNVNVSSAANAWYAQQILDISARSKASWQAVGRNLSTWRPVIMQQASPSLATDTQRYQGQLNGTRYNITGMSVGGSCTGGTFITVSATGSGSFATNDVVGIAGQTNINIGGPSNIPSISWSGTNPFTNASNTVYVSGNNLYTVTTGGTDQFTICMTPAVTGTYTSGGAVWRKLLSPNRPGDNVKYAGYAPYWFGAQITQASAAGESPYASTNRVNNMKGAGQAFNQAYLYVNGTASDKSNALDWIDNDTRQGTSPPRSVTLGADLKTFTASPSTDPAQTLNTSMLLIPGSGVLPTGFAANTPYFSTSVGSSTTFSLSTPAGSTVPVISASDRGTNPFTIGVLGYLGVGTLMNLDKGIATTLTGGPGLYGPIQSFAAQYTNLDPGGLKIISYEGGFADWAPSGTVLGQNGDTYDPPNSYGGNVGINTIDTSTGVISTTGAVNHNLAVGNAVLLVCTSYPGPGTFRASNGFSGYNPYYVVSTPSASTFTLSATRGGAAIAPSTSGSGCSFSHDAGNLYKLLYDYKQDTRFYNTVLLQLSQQVAKMPAGSIPAWFGEVGDYRTGAIGANSPSPWSLAYGDEVQGLLSAGDPAFSPYWQSYYALCHYNNGGC